MLYHRANRATLLLFVIALAFVLQPTEGLADSQTQALDKVNERLDTVNQTLGAAKTKQSKAQKSLAQVERDIAERSLRQQQTQDKLNDLEQQSAKLIVEKDALNTEYLASLEAVKLLLVNSYKMGRQSGLRRLLSQEDPTQISRFAKYASHLASSRRQLIEQTQALAAKAAKAETQLKQRSKQLAKLNLVLEQDQVYLGQLKQNRLSTLDQLDSEITDQSTRAKKLATEQARLSKLVNQLAKQRSKRETSSASAATLKSAAKAAMVVAGNLPLPVKAQLAAKFGQKRPETGSPWRGILLKGEAGTKVHSIAAGEVIYADWLTGYGQLIIIDHGNGLMSLYGHNRSLNKAVGDPVNQHDLISHMGDTAGLRSAALYFEIRHNGKPQDPLKWCRA